MCKYTHKYVLTKVLQTLAAILHSCISKKALYGVLYLE